MGLSATFSHPEFLDDVMVGACSRFSGLELPVAATLLLELHGSQHGLAEQQRQTGRDVTSNQHRDGLTGVGNSVAGGDVVGTRG